MSQTIPQKIYLVGNPNCGKTTLFNALTGLRQKTGNFHGVTVEKKSGSFRAGSIAYEIVDLPGAFSLHGTTEDKRVTSQILSSFQKEDKVLFVLDSLQIERSLQFLLQIIDIGIPFFVVFTMKDILKKKGIEIQLEDFNRIFGCQSILLNPKTKDGFSDLMDKLSHLDSFSVGKRIWSWNQKEETFYQKLLQEETLPQSQGTGFVIQTLLKNLSQDPLTSPLGDYFGFAFSSQRQKEIQSAITQNALKYGYEEELVAKARAIKSILAKVIQGEAETNTSSRLHIADKILLHPVLGLGIFLLGMALIFQALFSWSEIPMNAIEDAVKSLQDLAKEKLPAGPFVDLLTDGALGGVGAVLVFIPQIALLFLFLGLLEESGYLSRVSFLMDRFMGRFGLSGKSFIPLLSSAACAVPAILSTRTLENKSDRFTTILISPLIMCSARYPVYILIVGTVFPGKEGMALFALFLLGLVTSLLFGLLFRKTVFRHDSSYFLLDLPRYRLPSLASILLNVWNKVKAFLINAGQVILYISVVLWFLAYYPAIDTEDLEPSKKLAQSYAGQLGHFIEPAIEPLGFDWKIGVSLITSFAAREVMVSTLAILYGVGEDENEESETLRQTMQKDTHPKTGLPIWNPATAFSLLVFFAFASQCMSTLAVVRRETNSYLWAGFQFFYMTGLAIIASLMVYKIGNFLT